MSKSSQKFIARNRAPRVQIEYDVELYGAEKKVQLPFVMGVMSDLAGKSHLPQPPVADRKFLEIDVDTFDDRMRAMAPRAAFTVPNTVTGEGNLAIDLTFEKLDDFTPGALAAKVEALRPLLQARQELVTLMAYMDGKAGAEAAVEDVLRNPGALNDFEPEDKTPVDVSAVLDELRASQPAPAEEDVDDTLAHLAAQPLTEAPPETDVQDVLSDLAAVEPVGQDESESAAEVLGSLNQKGAAQEKSEAPRDDQVAETLAGLADQDRPLDTPAQDLSHVLSAIAQDPIAEIDAEVDVTETLKGLEPAQGGEPTDDPSIDDILGSLDAPEDRPDDAVGSAELDGILGDLGAEVDNLDPETEADDGETLNSLVPASYDAQTSDESIEDILGSLDAPETASDEVALDDILGELGGAEADDLDAMLGDLGPVDDETTGSEHDAPLDDPIGAELDTVLTEVDDIADPAAEERAQIDLDNVAFQLPFGTLVAARPKPEDLDRKRFRIALFGDFSGRAARGLLEVGADLGARPGAILDVDTVEELIESFATDLALPIGKDSAAITVPLRGLDDLHPDELYENVTLFSELVSLRQQLSTGASAEKAAQTLLDRSQKYGTPAVAPRRTSSANALPADCRLSDFQKLIGDTKPRPAAGSPIQDMMERVVGPHIRALPDADVTSMRDALDQSLSHAMRMVLHHPDFQAIEAQWRSLDLIARSVDTNDDLEIVLYDISAEEVATDLAFQEDMAQTGLLQLLTEAPLDPEEGRGGYSALIGLYNFEETPPHAQLLGRIARVAAHVDAPFFAAMSPQFLNSDKAERPRLVAEAWDELTEMAEAGHLGLVSPRFLLRRPYGAETEPIYEFEFEEFTEAEGLRGMLWGNPVALVAILLGRSFTEHGKAMNLGSIMSLGEMPFHFILDRFGDQVALPCTERNMDLDKIAHAQERGFMAVAAVKGRDEIRLTSFNSVKGETILGRWSGQPVPPPTEPDRAAPDPVAAQQPAAVSEPVEETPADLDDELDALLAGFDDETPDATPDQDEDDFDAELAALLDDL